MDSQIIRHKFLEFFEKKEHFIIPSSSVIPDKSDSSVLFTTAGMQQLKPYYLGEKSPYGNNVTSSQKCVRTSDIEEVGDERHLTFFEMLGNFSFGGYWKKEAISYAHEFVTKEMGLTIDYVTIFEGDNEVGEDIESANIWKTIDPTLVIKKFGRADNFWGPTGSEGPCGPTTEVYVNGIEIWNVVFNEYFKNKEGQFTKLEQTGIDTGMGLERLVMVMQKRDHVFETDLFTPMMSILNSRVAADHLRTSVFMIADGITPSNTDRGYILRRLLRRAYIHARKIGRETEVLNAVVDAVINHESYKGLYAFHEETNKIIMEEIEKFKKALDSGLKQVSKGEDPFVLFTSYGLPLEIIKEVIPNVDEEKFMRQMEEHKKLSSSAGEKKFDK